MWYAAVQVLKEATRGRKVQLGRVKVGVGRPDALTQTSYRYVFHSSHYSTMMMTREVVQVATQAVPLAEQAQRALVAIQRVRHSRCWTINYGGLRC